MMISLNVDLEFQYINLSSQPLSISTASNVKLCQMLCLAEDRCRTINFRQFTERCELFIDIPGSGGHLSTSVGTVFMAVIDSTRMLPGLYLNMISFI